MRCWGLALGGISVIFEASYPGIASQAVFLTFGTLGAMLLAYRSGLIRATERFKLGVMAATGGIAHVYLLSFILGFFGVGVPLIHSNGTFGILFSLFVVTIAALNLVLDFDLIERGVQRGAPRYMEWYGAFALLVTLVWLYLEILRLLAIYGEVLKEMKENEPDTLKMECYFADEENAIIVNDLFKNGAALGASRRNGSSSLSQTG